ncbi:MAG: hypothetical protein LBR29_11870, partial [Methylobacteriaceae bacterium]|nr:hypothetical protein [Methylobacteriaceae bacterium]
MNSFDQAVIDRLQRKLDEIEKRVKMEGSYTRIDPYITEQTEAGITFRFIIYHTESKLWFDAGYTDGAMHTVSQNNLLREDDIVFDLGCNSG